jgi:hypothetical protein
VLKKRVRKMQKNVYDLQLAKARRDSYKYSLEDWTAEDIREVIFPVGRGYFDSTNQSLCEKWEDTDWSNSEYLSLLTVEELKRLEYWLKKEEIAYA